MFHGFVVLVGVLILSGAVNTAILGANGVLNRLSEMACYLCGSSGLTKVRHQLSRHQPDYVAANPTIVLSRGNFYFLAGLYAFGVVWSFAFNGLAVAILRFKYPEHREWKVPGNLKLGKHEIPIGLGLITPFSLPDRHREPAH